MATNGRRVTTEDTSDDLGEDPMEAAIRDGVDDREDDAAAAEELALHEVDGEEAGVVEEEAEDDLETSLTQAMAERDELRERLMRALAETENVRKRAERDVKDAQAYAGTKLARDILGVYDNLGRALDAADEGARKAAGPVMEGIELTRNELSGRVQEAPDRAGGAGDRREVRPQAAPGDVRGARRGRGGGHRDSGDGAGLHHRGPPAAAGDGRRGGGCAGQAGRRVGHGGLSLWQGCRR